MTKRHFEAIARMLREQGETLADPTQAADIAHRDLVDGMASYFADQNPRFDRERFLTACGF